VRTGSFGGGGGAHVFKKKAGIHPFNIYVGGKEGKEGSGSKAVSASVGTKKKKTLLKLPGRVAIFI